MSLVAVVALALSPAEHSAPQLGDKLQHVMAFVVMTILAHLSYRRSRTWLVAGSMFLLGLAIEMAQAVPFIGRQSDPLDLMANGLGIAIATCLNSLHRWATD